ncbi:MAG TPA: FliA/WhiG family RNA polymerase sigma factor [Bacteroidota bacterium]|nr:FliA/WhiG family RNA polymerase sigma factor [Bacteroidota bacterium]
MMQTTQEKQNSLQPDALSAEKRPLFFQNLNLVGYVVHKMIGFGNAPQPLEQSDLIQLGMIGLLDAVDRFDPNRGVQFQTYAVSRIRGTIQDELRKLDWIPRSVRKIEREQNAKLQVIENQANVNESHEEIAQRLSMTMDEYRNMLDRATGVLSERIVGLDEDDDSNDSLATGKESDPFEQLSQAQVREEVFNAIEQLPARDRLVLVLYYYEELTFKEIARVLNISESRASQIHTTVIEYLRQTLKELQ